MPPNVIWPRPGTRIDRADASAAGGLDDILENAVVTWRIALGGNVNEGKPLAENLDEVKGLPDRPTDAGLAAEVSRSH
jgi:hypothetical protein